MAAGSQRKNIKELVEVSPMLRHVWILSAAGILAVASSSVAETGSIGTVDELINIAYRQPVDQPRAQLVLADQLYQNETLETEPDASLQVTFLDGTSLRLEGSSKVVLDQYVYNPASADSAAVMNFGAGVFRFVTGSIQHEDVQLETAAATIGIRGTVLGITVGESGSTTVDVLEGAASAKPRGGGEEVVAKKGQRIYVASANDHAVVSTIPGDIPQTQEQEAFNAPEKAPAKPEPEPEPEPEPDPTGNRSGQGDGTNPGHSNNNNGGQGNPNNSGHNKH
jgi:hypothetical protein